MKKEYVERFLLIHSLALKIKVFMFLRKSIYICAIINVFTIKFCISQQSILDFNLLCKEYNPCLYWDSVPEFEYIRDFYKDIYINLDDDSSQKLRYYRDSLLLYPNWGDTLFEKRVACSECLIDLLYEMYVENSIIEHEKSFIERKDSVEVVMIYNSDTIKYNPKQIEVFCYQYDTIGKITNCCRAISYDKGFLFPYNSSIYPTYAILKYKKVYYSIGWIFCGDEIHINILDYSKKRWCCKKYLYDCKIKVTHYRNFSQFSNRINNIRKYSKKNKREIELFW